MRSRKKYAALLFLFVLLFGCIGPPEECDKIPDERVAERDKCYILLATSKATNGEDVVSTCEEIKSARKKNECYKSAAIAFASIHSPPDSDYRQEAIDACKSLTGLLGAGEARRTMCLMDIAKRMKDPDICRNEIGWAPRLFSADTIKLICEDMAEPKGGTCLTAPALILLMAAVMLAKS